MNYKAIILAAGTASRLGQLSKPLIKVNGVSLIEKLINSLKKAGIHNITVVIGYQSAQLREICANLGVNTIFNPNYHNGNHQESLEIALRSKAASDTSEATIITLVDQPLLNSELITKLINHFEPLKGFKDAIYPVKGNERGNPIIVSNKLLMMSLECKPFNLKEFIRQNSKKVSELTCIEPGYFVDIDTEIDIQHLYQTYGIKLELPIS